MKKPSQPGFYWILATVNDSKNAFKTIAHCSKYGTWSFTESSPDSKASLSFKVHEVIEFLGDSHYTGILR